MPAVTPADVHTLPSLHEDAVALDLDLRDAPRRADRTRAQCVVARLPSSRPGRGEHERAGAHRRDPPAAAREVRDRAHELRITGGGERSLTADDDERVDRAPHRRERPVGHDARAPHGDDRPGLRRGDDELVPARHAEHLVRPDQVERGDAGIDDEDDAAAHAGHSARRRRLAAMTFSGRFLPPRRSCARSPRSGPGCYKEPMTERTYRLISADSHVNEPPRPLDRPGAARHSATGRPASSASSRATRG